MIGLVGATEWSVTAPVDSTITLSVLDCCVTGDVFGFLLNGVATPWDNEGINGAGYFFASITVLFVGGVESLFSIDVLVGGGGFPGEGTATISKATPVAAVPLPAGAPLLLLGLGGLTFLRRRKRA